MVMSSAFVVDCAAIFWIIVLMKWMSPQGRKHMLPDVALAFSGLPVPYEALQQSLRSKFMLGRL